MCCPAEEEKGTILLLLSPESQSLEYGLASLHTEAGERRKDRVNNSFLLVARGCSSAGLRVVTHPHIGMVQCKQEINPLLESSVSSVINFVRC